MRNDLGLVPTPLTMDQIRSVLREALDQAGHIVSPKAAGVILAHIAYENAHGERVIQHNFGNLIATQQWAGDFWRPTWFAPPKEGASQRDRELHEKMRRGEAPAAFRAYDSPQEGMKFFVETLHRLGLLQAAEGGPSGYAQKAVLQFSPGVNPDHLTQVLSSIVDQLNGTGPRKGSGTVLALLTFGALAAYVAVTVTKEKS